MPHHRVDDTSPTPWSLIRSGFDEPSLDEEGAMLALSNGYLGWRATLDEGDWTGTAGVYLNGVFEQYEMPYAEEGFGYPDHGQTAVDVADGRVIRLLVDDDPLDLRAGTVQAHERRLDFAEGTLRRRTEWTSPAGRTVLIDSERLVSLGRRAVGAVRYRVEAVDGPLRVTVQSELVANGHPSPANPNPAIEAALSSPLEPLLQNRGPERASLVHRTRASGLTVAVAMRHTVEASSAVTAETEISPDLARTTFSAMLNVGESLTVTKFVGHDWSKAASAELARDHADAAAADAAALGWTGLLEQQQKALAQWWAHADIEVDDSRLQQAVRFALFHLFQATSRAEERPVPGKGLTGAGYDGHAFWDDDAFVVPVLSHILPASAQSTLRWRHRTLGHAIDRARQLRLSGAAFPWRSIDGREASGYWPAGTAAFHVNADIAAGVVRYVRATGDHDFEREIGLELLIHTARLWLDLGRWDRRGGFHLDGVTGPDEYSALGDDNLYTNVMAQQNLDEAAAAARRHPEQSRQLGVSDDEIERWEQAAAAMTVLYDDDLGVHPQSAGFLDHELWDFEAMTAEDYPLQAHFHYFELYRRQVVKQADTVLALYFRSELFTPVEKARDFAYYEAITVRDSSLSSAAQSIIAAEVGHLDLAADHLFEAAMIDLEDRQGDTEGGVHIAASAGVWMAVVAGLGGMRHTRNGLSFAPRLPSGIGYLRFRLLVEQSLILAEVTPEATTYTLLEGPERRFDHFATSVTLHSDAPQRCDTPPLPDPGPPPTSPRWRAPHR